MGSVATVEEIEVVTTRPAPETKGKRKRQPQYVVIVENDDDHTYDYVVLGLCKVCGVSEERAFQLASQLGEVRVANVVDPNYTVVAKFPKKFLPPR